MNLIGKIFVVLILIMSVVFMGLATAVYSTHTNWREVIMNPQTGLKKQLDDLKAANQNLTETRARMEKDYAAELKARDDSLRALETAQEELRGERDRMQRENAELVQGERQAVAAMDATQKTLQALRGEVDGLRQSIRDVQADKEAQFKELVRVQDELLQAQGEEARLTEKNMQLLEQVARQKTVLERHSLDEFEPVDGIPPRVDGVVLATDDKGMVEISLGSDDGLRKGHTLEVYRANKYLGRIEVIKTSPDHAVARIIPEYRQGHIQREDRVASRLN